MATSLRHSLICCGVMPGGASSIAIRLPCCSQWLISAVCTAFHRPRSSVPSAFVAAVTRSGTIDHRDVVGDGEAVDALAGRLGAGELAGR